MKELSIEKMEMVSGGCSSTDLFAYAAAQSYYGIKSAQNPGSDFILVCGFIIQTKFLPAFRF